jgi:hypothetical protein
VTQTEPRNRPDEAATVLTDTSTPLIFHPKRSSAIWLLMGCSAFVGIGIWMGVSGEWTGFLFAGLSALGIPVAVIQMMPGSTFLRLDPTGITYSTLFRRASLSWLDVEEFFVVTMTQTGINVREMVGFNFVPTYDRARTARAVAKVIGKCEGALPDTYGRKAEELARILNARLSAARAHKNGLGDPANESERVGRAP